jgi:hypothetical protein
MAEYKGFTGPAGLIDKLKRAEAEREELRRIVIYQQLLELNVDPITPAGLAAIDNYQFAEMPEKGLGGLDLSLMTLRVWLANHVGEVV